MTKFKVVLLPLILAGVIACGDKDNTGPDATPPAFRYATVAALAQDSMVVRTGATQEVQFELRYGPEPNCAQAKVSASTMDTVAIITARPLFPQTRYCYTVFFNNANGSGESLVRHATTPAWFNIFSVGFRDVGWHEATVTWETSVPTRNNQVSVRMPSGQVRVVAAQDPERATSHEALIDGLDHGTEYTVVEVSGRDANGRRAWADLNRRFETIYDPCQDPDATVVPVVFHYENHVDPDYRILVWPHGRICGFEEGTFDNIMLASGDGGKTYGYEFRLPVNDPSGSSDHYFRVCLMHVVSGFIRCLEGAEISLNSTFLQRTTEQAYALNCQPSANCPAEGVPFWLWRLEANGTVRP